MSSLTSGRLKSYWRKLVVLVSAIAIMIFAWANLCLNLDAYAATAEGIGNKIEGKVEKDIGTVERNFGKVTGQTEGALKQAKGKAKQDIGTTQNKLDEAGNKVENTSESLIDSVKDFFE